jgi:hypothetical protein
MRGREADAASVVERGGQEPAATVAVVWYPRREFGEWPCDPVYRVRRPRGHGVYRDCGLPAYGLPRFLAILYAGAIAAWGGAPPETEAPNQVTEHINTVLRQKVYSLDLIPRQCAGKETSEYFCWEVYSTAWQALDKSRKGISLVIHLWVNGGPPRLRIAIWRC